jgi:CPA2 family monovalent cation:H+ antiporter-2
MVGKPLAALAIVLLLGYPVRAALAVAVALAQIGEFSFMLGTLGVHLKVLPGDANNALAARALASSQCPLRNGLQHVSGRPSAAP